MQLCKGDVRDNLSQFCESCPHRSRQTGMMQLCQTDQSGKLFQAVKKLAMLGCALLVLAHSVKHKIPANSYAGALSVVERTTLPGNSESCDKLKLD